MDHLSKNITGIPLGIFPAIIMTACVFLALPQLTQIEGRHSDMDNDTPVLISVHRPPPPPAENRDQPEKPEPVEKRLLQKMDRPEKTQPRIDIPKVTIAMGDEGIGGVKISVISGPAIPETERGAPYSIAEVDQPPRLLSSFSPQYPIRAARDNIEGWVLLRFVVDSEGLVKEPEVMEAKPEGLFDEAALKVVIRYRFKPAVKNSEPVTCIVRQRIVFQLD